MAKKTNKNYVPQGASPITGVLPVKNRNVSSMISPITLTRIKQDVLTWRDAIREAEIAWYPFRVKMQQAYQDTVLNGQVESCMKKRKNMVLQKKYELVDEKGVKNEQWTEWAQGKWFTQITNLMLDKMAFGYSLVNYDSIFQNTPQNIKLVKRQNVSPDRLNVTSMMYLTTGENFNDPTSEYYLWTLYFDTPNETAASNCGYGYLYKVALYEIFCRNLLGYNGDFVELFSQPFRVGKTQKTDDDDRQEFEKAIKDMGSAGYAIIDPNDEIDFLQAATSSTGWQSYANFEERLEKKISKIILGHGDAMDSISGKLGSSEEIKEALEATETSDLSDVTDDWNTIVLPKLRECGISIPENLKVRFKNDAEIEEFRKLQDESNKVTAEIAKTMVDAGLKMDAKYFEERTGIPTEAIEVQSTTKAINNLARIKNLYNPENL